MNAPEPVNVTDVGTTEKMKLWELQRLLNNRKGSLSSTFQKNVEANTRAYGLIQKTMQALDALAEDYEIFEETMTYETEEGDMLYAVAHEAMEELDRARRKRTVCMTKWRPRVRAWVRI